MHQVERKIIDTLYRHTDCIFFVIITILSIVMRIGLFPIVSTDANSFLLPWFDEIKQNGGFDALSQQTGDYGIFYQTLIAWLTYLPIPALSAYKILSCIFDYFLAIGGMLIVEELTHKRIPSLWAYALILCSPIVLLNSAAWSQCDAMYASLCLWTIYFCLTEKFSPMLIAYGIAITLKLQAIFLLPFLLLIYVTKKSFSILKFLYIPAIMIFLSLPGILHGRKLWDVFLIYVSQSKNYNCYLTMNYPGLWALFSTQATYAAPTYSLSASILSICFIGMIFYYFIKKYSATTKETLISIAFLLVYAAVLTMPHMHERYGYLYEVLALVIVVINKRTIFPCILLQLISFCTYSSYLMNESHSLALLAMVNITVFLYYFWTLCVRNINASQTLFDH